MNTPLPPIEIPSIEIPSTLPWPTRDGPNSFDHKECLIMDELLNRIKKAIDRSPRFEVSEAIADHLAFSQACHLRMKIVDATCRHHPPRTIP